MLRFQAQHPLSLKISMYALNRESNPWTKDETAMGTKRLLPVWKKKWFWKATITFLKVSWAGGRTQDLLISFIFSFHHLTDESQRLPPSYKITQYSEKFHLNIIFENWKRVLI
jgi:hypothetical protein